MILRLTEEQLMWVLEGTRFEKKAVNMFRDHFVNGVPRVQAAAQNELSQPFSSKKYARFEEILAKKCDEHGLKVSTILHRDKDTQAVYGYDATSTIKKD